MEFYSTYFILLYLDVSYVILPMGLAHLPSISLSDQNTNGIGFKMAKLHCSVLQARSHIKDLLKTHFELVNQT